jgi:integrase/recombinase XerC
MTARTLADLADLYLLRCEVEGKSPRTVLAYRWTLQRFLSALAEVGAPADPAAINRDHLYGYLGRFTHLAPDTRHRYFREVRCFFNWLVDSGYLDQSPFRGVKNIRVPQRIVRPFARSELTRLLDACAHDPVGVRNRAVVMTLLDTGLRCSEAVQLDLDDLDLAAQRLRVRFGKGNKQRIVPFADTCRDAIVAYLEFRGAVPGPLFLASNGHGAFIVGTGLRPNGLKQMLRRLGRKSGVAKVHAHRFRHTFATWAIEHDARELDVQYLLGHSSPDMVRRYSSTYRSEQAAMRHHRFSPADQMLSTHPSVA